MGRAHDLSRRTAAEPDTPRQRPPAPSLADAVGNRAFAALARRPVTVELRKPPPWPDPGPAVDRTTPENRKLAEDVDALTKLTDAELIKARTEATLAMPRTGVLKTEHEEHDKAMRRLQAIEYVIGQRMKQARWEGTSSRERDLGPVKPDWSHWAEVKRDPKRRQAWVRWLVEQRVREEGSLEDALAVIKSTETYGADLSEIEDDLAQIRRERDDFAREFTNQARENAKRVLAGSLGVIDKTLSDYGVPLDAAHGAASEIDKTERGIPAHHVGAGDAADLVITAMDKDLEAANATSKIKNRLGLRDSARRLGELQAQVKATEKAMWKRAAEGKDAVKEKTAFVAAKEDLTAAWFVAERKHPVLASYRRGATQEKGSTASSALAGVNLAGLTSMDMEADMKAMLVHVLPTLAHIGRAKAKIDDGMSPMKLPAVVALTEANMFIPAGSIRAGVVHDLVEKEQREPWLVLAAGLALSLVTLIPSFGASLAIVNVAAGAYAAYTALGELDKYETQKVLFDTDLDRARSLSQTEPSLVGFALSLVSLGLEPLIAWHALSKAAELRTLVRQGRPTKLIVDELDQLGGSKAPKLGQTALREIERLEAAAAHEVAALKSPIVDPWFNQGLTAHARVTQVTYDSADKLRDGLVKALRSETRHGAAPADALIEKVREAINKGLVPRKGNEEVLDLFEQVYRLNRDPEAIADGGAALWKASGGRTTREGLEAATGPFVDVRKDLTRDILRGDPTFRDLALAWDVHGAHTHMFSEYLLDLKLGAGTGRRFRKAVANAIGPEIEHNGRTREFWEAMWDAIYDVDIDFKDINSPEVLGPILQKHLGLPRWRPPPP